MYSNKSKIKTIVVGRNNVYHKYTAIYIFIAFVDIIVKLKSNFSYCV